MKRMIIVFLLVCGVGFGADAYVNSAAADDTGNGLTVGTAKKLIGSAYTVAGDGDTVYFADGTYDLDDETANYLFLSLDKSVTFRSSSADPSLVNIISETATATQFHTRLFLDNLAVRIEFIDLTFTGSANLGAFYGIIYNDGSAASTNTADLYVENCVFIPNGHPGYAIQEQTGATKYFGNTIIKNITATAAKIVYYADKNKKSLRVTGSTLKNDNDGTAEPIIFYGVDGVINDMPCGSCYIANNTFEYTGQSANHAILVGSGVDPSEITSNIIIAPDVDDDDGNIGIVVKSDGHTIDGNIITANRCVFFNGSKNNRLINNTLIASDAYSAGACVHQSNAWYDDGGTQTRRCTGNYIVNNIFASGKFSYFINTDKDALLGGIETTDEGIFTNYNSYNNLTAMVRDDVNSRQIADLDALKVVWTTETTPWADVFNKDNDENSIEADPQLDSNNKPRNSALKEGKLDANGDETSIGAIGSTGAGGGYRSRYR